MKKVILLLFVVSNLFSQVEYSGNKNYNFLPKFFIDLASYKGTDSLKSKVDVFLKVPYSNVQFLKTNKGYVAKYTVTISVYNKDDEKLIIEKLWNEKIVTSKFKQTASRRSFNISYKTFSVPPGEYKFVCKLEDVESRKHATYERFINIREFKDPIELSDIVIVSKFINTKKGKKIIPNIANLVTSKDSALSFFYEIYSDRDDSLKLSYVINNKDGQILFIKDKKIKVTKGTNEFNETISNLQFTLGDYQFEVKILDKHNKMIKGSGKKFSSKIYGFPTSIRNLDLAIKQMQYIASPSDIDEIESAKNYSEKLKKFLFYWKRLDPSPNTVENETLDEYYRRVEYANANFKGYFKGWRSDMGMVYITLGPPDQVLRRPYEIDSRPYEVWDYYVLNRSFIFVDQTNFGDYRLQNPAYGDWFRYRP